MQPASEPTLAQKLAPLAIGVAILVCSTELAPGWELFHLGWPPEAYYAIMAMIAALAGAVAVPGYSIPGVIAGSVSGLGALVAVVWHLTLVTETMTSLIVLVGAVGAFPGIGLFFFLKRVQDAL